MSEEKVISSQYLVQEIPRFSHQLPILSSKFFITRFESAGEVGAPCGKTPLRQQNFVSITPTNLGKYLVLNAALQTCSNLMLPKKSVMSSFKRYLLPTCGSALPVSLAPFLYAVAYFETGSLPSILLFIFCCLHYLDVLILMSNIIK